MRDRFRSGSVFAVDDQAVRGTSRSHPRYRTGNPYAAPIDIVAGPDQNLWVFEQNITKIARVVPATAAITEFGLPQIGHALIIQSITSANGALWCTLGGYTAIGRITTSGQAAFVLGSQRYAGIAKGPDNNLWMTDTDADNLSSVSCAGTDATPVALGIPSHGLVTGPDQNIWFTDAANNSIDVYILHPQTVTQTAIPSIWRVRRRPFRPRSPAIPAPNSPPVPATLKSRR